MVAGIFCDSVVARMNIACGGGSSRVLRSALKASVVNWCASSITYTLYCPMEGAKRTLSRRSRISSMPRFEAASISMRSRKRPSRIATQVSHRSQGSPSFALGQFTAFAISRAMEVLPVPRTPDRR
jgi:hypothetical protein